MAETPIRVILTGGTGMVGEGVLHECLLSPNVESVLLITRKPTNRQHPKFRELVVPDFFDLSPVASQLTGYDACFFCLGVSSVGMSKEQYEKLTYELTLKFAGLLAAQNPGMVFCYVSGKGTDSSEKSKLHWARVKGKTENDLQQLPFRAVYNFRPGVLKPTPGLQNTLSFYKWAGWLIPVIQIFSPGSVGSLKELGRAMIHVVLRGYPKKILEVKDIRTASGE
ncbi:MAG TPA: NAD-dependent epimerase/dehydratase family protein [Puia sp.]|nr:NAD-dependent epimerase/dehydratase family protein [Puia sp.]